MRRDAELDRRLSELRAPDEDAAEARAWEVVSAAYADRAPAPRPVRGRRFALALAAAVAVLAVGLSPAGAAVADLVRSVIGTEAGDPEPSLTRLPTAGEMLVESGDGVWIVREDGSKRRLGDFDEASWSPNGLFVAATDGRQLAAVDPLGEVRWAIPAPREAHDPRWSGTDVDTRIAYRSAGDLRVVAGDGTGDALVARDVSPIAPAWRPAPEAKLGPELGSRTHVLAYAASASSVRITDTDGGDVLRRIVIPGRAPIDEIEFSADGSFLLVRTGDALLAFEPEGGRLAWRSSMETSAAALSPDGRHVATITQPDEPNGESRLVLIDAGTGEERRLPAGLGRFTDIAWSPDGRWLVLGWTAADQWLFVRVRGNRPGRVIAVGGISRQFAPGSGAEASFPGIAGWMLTDPP